MLVVGFAVKLELRDNDKKWKNIRKVSAFSVILNIGIHFELMEEVGRALYGA